VATFYLLPERTTDSVKSARKNLALQRACKVWCLQYHAWYGQHSEDEEDYEEETGEERISGHQEAQD
jgi:hypothetical protein